MYKIWRNKFENYCNTGNFDTRNVDEIISYNEYGKMKDIRVF